MLLSLLLSAALAWDTTGTTWTWQSHPVEDPFALDVDSFPSDEVDPDELREALDGAMASWSTLGLDLSLSREDDRSGGVLAADGQFTVLHDAYDGMGGVLAFTGTWTWDDYAGFDCDVVFLDYDDYGDIVWSADPAGAPSGTVDVQAVALHELGHCLGLNHSADASAVMYAYYTGLRDLSDDDIEGVSTLFSTGCTDGDGDGVTGCDGDCDDDNALISPAVEEVCDGLDDNCNGAIDEEEGALASLSKAGVELDSSWISAGDVFRVDSATTLRSFKTQLTAAEGARLVWTVFRSDDGGTTWSLVRELRSEATSEEWQESPRLDLPLSAGVVYETGLGVLGDLTLRYQRRPDLSAQGPITPLGYVYGRALGDQLTVVDDATLINQELTFTAAADPDGDGQTALCGDCSDEDATVAGTAAELCDGADQDCDGLVDEDFADSDADGAADCVDPCPEDALDDADADGACADADPCPDDPLDACDDPLPVDTGETGTADSDPPQDSGSADSAVETPKDGGCGCGGGGAPSLLGVALTALALRRRRLRGR